MSKQTSGAPTPTVPPVRPGIHPRWRSDAAWLKHRQKADPFGPSFLQAQRERRESMRIYADGGNPFKDLIDPSQPLRGPMHYRVAQTLAIDPAQFANLHPLVDGLDAWLPQLATGLWCSYWRWQIEWQLHCLPAARGPVWLHAATDLLAKCLFVGWMEEARVTAAQIRQVYLERKLTNTEGKESQPLSHFLLRIAFDHWALPFDHWGRGRHPKLDAKNAFRKGQCLGEPVLNELFDHWRDPDLTPLLDHLLWLCDYATHRVKQNMEYEYDPFGARFPGVLLPWMRLREAHGLGAPPVDHPLLASPFDRLPVPQPRPTDPLLEAVLDRLEREELPTLRSTGRDGPAIVDSCEA